MTERLLSTFDVDVIEWCAQVKASASDQALQALSSGRGRQALDTICSNAYSMLPPLEYVQLSVTFGQKLIGQCEWVAAKECCFEPAAVVVGGMPNPSPLVIQLQIECAIFIAQCEYAHLVSPGLHVFNSPRTISALLECLKAIERGIIVICSQSTADQANCSWLVRRAIQILVELSEPIIAAGCAAYVVHFLVCGILAMETIPALTTTRHLKIRMKLYCLIVQCLGHDGDFQGCVKVLQHAEGQVKSLRTLEENDLPLQEDVAAALLDAEADIRVLQCITANLEAGKINLGSSQSVNLPSILLEHIRFYGLRPDLYSRSCVIIGQYVQLMSEPDLDKLLHDPKLCTELAVVMVDIDRLDLLPRFSEKLHASVEQLRLEQPYDCKASVALATSKAVLYIMTAKTNGSFTIEGALSSIGEFQTLISDLLIQNTYHVSSDSAMHPHAYLFTTGNHQSSLHTYMFYLAIKTNRALTDSKAVSPPRSNEASTKSLSKNGFSK